jgi:hypothetical protein
MKRELRKCLKTIARCKTNLNSENRCNERKFNQSLIGENREKREEKEEREKLENCIKAIQQIKKSLKDMEEF